MARTLNCHGWPSLAATLPKVEGNGTGSLAAQLGTALHDAMEWIVDNNSSPSHCIDETFNGFVIDHEMAEEQLTPAFLAIYALMEKYRIKK